MVLNNLKWNVIAAILTAVMCVPLRPADGQLLSRNDTPDRIDSIVGTIEGRHRNSIEVYDELDKRVKRFVYMSDDGTLKIGDRVRVYYYPRGYVVQSIKKMQVVPDEEGKNQGYLFKNQSSRNVVK